MKVCTSLALQAARLSRARKTTQYGGPVSSGGRKHSVPISTFVLNTLTLSSRNMLLHSDKVYRIFSFVMSEATFRFTIWVLTRSTSCAT